MPIGPGKRYKSGILGGSIQTSAYVPHRPLFWKQASATPQILITSRLFLCFALYILASAHSRRAIRVAASSGYTAQPMLAEARISARSRQAYRNNPEVAEQFRRAPPGCSGSR
jgi:hypothetical protein